MRIAMIQDEWWPERGGGAIHVEELSRALAKYHNCSIDIYTRALEQDGDRYESIQRLESGGVTIHRLGPCTEYWNPYGRVSSAVTPLPKLLQGNYDIIHGHANIPAVPTRLSRMFTSVPTVFTIHGTTLSTGEGRDQTIFSNLKRQLEKLFILYFDYNAVISVNSATMELLKKHHDSVHQIPNGLNLSLFSNGETKKKEILFVGRLAPVKRVADLVEAFAQLADEFPKWTLRIVGDGPERDALTKRAMQLGIEHRVRFDGTVPRDEIPEKYASVDVFVLPSIREGHPFTLLEAWASELPVITTEVEGIREFVDHGETGYLVPPKSPDQLAEGLRFTLENPDEARQWGQNGRQLVATEYTWKSVAERTHKLYRELV